MNLAQRPAGDLFEGFSRCGFESRSTVIAAVSGGSDSTALLLLLKNFIDQAAPATRIVAVTVDHGLRAESADEAVAVRQLAARLEVEHRILRWSGPKPATGIAAAAREARYSLLAQAAFDAGTDIVLTAHTADDQAETVFMRRQRGDGMGLAGMASATLFDGKIWIARPLLAVRRETLRHFLRANSVGWIDDPSNVDRRSERVRIRSELSGSHDADADIEAILELARRNAVRREERGGRAAALISSFARQVEPGLIHLDPGFLRDRDGEATIHALRALLAVTGGMPHLPDERRTAALAARLAELPHRATLSRALVASRRDGVWLCRERRGLPESGPAREAMIWDGRFRISAVGSAAEASIAPDDGTPVSEIEGDHGAPKSLIRLARASSPVFLHRDEQFADVRAAPHRSPLPVKNGERVASTLTQPSPRSSPGEGCGEGQRDISERFTADPTGCWTATPILSLYARFLPSFDIELARAVSALIGAPPFPDPPCAGHNVGQA